MKHSDTLRQQQIKKEELLLSLGARYQKALEYLDCSEDKLFQNGDDYEFAKDMLLTLRRIPKTYGIILINEFFQKKQNDWWRGEYRNRFSFHCYKAAAIDDFIEQLPSQYLHYLYY